MEIIKKKLSEMSIAPYNPRKITKEEMAKLKKSIETFGYQEPIIWNKRTNNIVGGNQRATALKELYGQDYEAEIVVVDLDEKQEKILNIALNRISGEFDNDKLAELLAKFDNIEQLLTGFDKDEISQILDRLKSAEEDDFDAEASLKNPKYKIERGEIWQCGNHKVMCGDATSKEDAEKLMDGKKADMVFTDPPYGVSIGAKNRMLNTFQKAGRCLDDIKEDEKKPEDLYPILLSAFKNMKEACSDCCSLFVTAPQGGELGMMMMMMMRDAGLPVRHVLIWKKNAPTFSMGRLDYDYQHEPILLTWTERHKFYGGGQHKTSIWEIDKPRASKEHPTMKPVALVANALLNNSLEGNMVIDFFLGSGTTLIACEQLNRICFGMEISPEYCSVIIERFEKISGKTAVKMA